MKIINLDQGSAEWLTWRRSLLTATDASTLLGENKYVTPYKGWQRKLLLVPEQVETDAMRRGKRDEPIARELFIKEYGINMTPVCVQSESFSWIGASLDGLSDCQTMLLEIKSQPPVTEIPMMHKIQMYHQMISTDLKVRHGYYVSHWKGENLTFELDIDMNWVKFYLPKAEEFWRRCIFFDPPPMTNKDYQFRGDELNWMDLAKEYRKVCEEEKAIADKKDYLRKQIIALCGEDSCYGSGIKVMKKVNKGRIDYDEACSILNIRDEMLEPFRKPSSSSWAIMLDK